MDENTDAFIDLKKTGRKISDLIDMVSKYDADPAFKRIILIVSNNNSHNKRLLEIYNAAGAVKTPIVVGAVNKNPEQGFAKQPIKYNNSNLHWVEFSQIIDTLKINS